MNKHGFFPKEILFSLTAKCNLRCAHCDIDQYPGVLNKRTALKFLTASSRSGIKRVGFTGGEPFLALDLMCAISEEAAKRDMLFGCVMTNGSWFRTDKELASKLYRLFRSRYDGDICLSIDAFHHQSIKKCASFIRTAASVWRRHDIISIASVKGAKEYQTRKMLTGLAKILGARIIIVHGKPVAMKNESLFIRIFYIDLSPIGKAAKLKKAWNGKWFKDDLCRGPGNVLFVLPDGMVKPCCGYAADTDILTIGSIGRDSPKQLIHNARENKFIASLFSSGLHPIRKRLEKGGVRFPGRTTNHCFFCHYITHYVPQLKILF